MDSFNKTISFILGLVVVIVFLAVITGRFNLKNKLPILSGKIASTEEATPTPTETKGLDGETYNSYKTSTNNLSGTKINAKSIPSTGSPTLLLPLLFSGLAGGFFLKKAGKNNN